MSSVIPGGRQRSSSFGDILDEGLCGALFVNLNDHNCIQLSRKTHFKAANHYDAASTGHLEESDVVFDSDSEFSSQSQRRGFSFKSVGKAVSRAFVKDSKLGDGTEKRNDKIIQSGGQSQVWTPDLRRRIATKHSHSELLVCGTVSTARPLITVPNVRKIVPKWAKTPGVVGICNHGNTCFMNAVLQCLSNTDSFTEYFVRDFFKNDLKNSTNAKKGPPRSSHGEVTEQLGHFLKYVWSGKYSSEVSKELKLVIGKFSDQYKGNEQHDSQEFLLWLLDRIHEDAGTFTRRKVKHHKTPTVRPDKELASEAAVVNGESFILKLFQALHRSTVACPTCGECSSSFDPYLCLSLPLPQGYQRVVYVMVVSLEDCHMREVKRAFVLNQYAEILELRELVAADTNIPSKQLLLVQLKDDGFGATYSNDQLLSDIPENEVVYAIESLTEETDLDTSEWKSDSSNCYQLLVIHVEVSAETAQSYRFGSPAVMKVRRDVTWKSLQMEILRKMEDCLCKEFWSQAQNLDGLLLVRVCDGSSHGSYLSHDVDMPLLTRCAEKAYNNSSEDLGPAHIKIIVEWDTETKREVFVADQPHIETHPSVSAVLKNEVGHGTVTLEECLRLYTQEEKLSGDDAWLCPHCKQQQQDTIKTLSLWSLPEILVLHLKRFKQSGHRRSKLNTLINFPLDNLDMSSFLTNHSQNHHLRSDDYTYDLLGVINHYGNMMGGHYTAYCCSPIDGKWREYNDDKVCSLESPVPTREAYILFYQRRSLSKHIKQRLFTGDHWIHLLPHSPLENSEESSVLDRPVELGQCLQRVRSQSVSPYFHQQKHGMLKTTHNIHSYSLTPQPIRRSLMLHTKELNVNSSSANYSSPQTLRRLSHSAQRHDSDQEFRYGGCIEDLSSGTNQKKTNNDKKGLYQNRYTPQLGRDISQAQTHSKSPTMHKSPPAASLIRHDLSRNNNLSVSLSRTANHQVSLTRSSPDSHDSHPSSSSSYQQTKYSETDKQLGIFESDIDSQVKQHGKHNVSRHDDSPYVSVTENSGEKLVHTVGQNNVNRQQEVSEHASTNTSDRDDSFVRRYSRKHRQKRLAKHEDDIMDRIDDAAKYNDHYILEDSFYSDTENKNAGSHHGQQYAHSSKSGHIETGFFHVKGDSDADSDPSKKSSLHSGYSWEPNHEALSSRAYRQAERQGAKTSYSRERSTSRLAGDALYQNSEHLEHSHLNGGISYQRHATNSQTYNTSQTVGFEGDVHTHSHTDYISNNEPELSARCYSHQKEQKSASLSSSFTPPKDDYSAAGQMLSRKLPSTHTHERTRHLSNDQRSLASFGNSTLPGCTPGSQENKYNFHPPRGVIITTRAETSMRNTRNIPTPCLRESSL